MASPVHPYSDYGVALRTLKSARGWLALLLFLCVVCQWVGFGLMYGTGQPYKFQKPGYTVIQEEPTRFQVAGREWRKWWHGEATTQDATQPGGRTSDTVFFEGTPQSRRLNIHEQWDATYTMTVPMTQVLGLMAACSQTIIVFLTLLVILVAQAPGVAQVTRSLIWTTLLLFMVLPWQYFARSYPVPGILYGYDEMLRMIARRVVGEKLAGYEILLIYARFIIWPAMAMLVLLITSERFRAGIMLAIGHPLQSMMQPRNPMMPGVPSPLGTVSPLTKGGPEKK